MAKTNTVLPVIMCGGSGSRLWPLSRTQLPKQFVPLPAGDSLIERTMVRVAGLGGDHIVAVCAADHVAHCRAAHAKAGLKVPLRLVVEPAALNTAAAAAAAAAYVAANWGAKRILALLPADHTIADEKAFARAIAAAASVAERGHLVLLGIKPDRPATGYGYVKRGGQLAGSGYEVSRFVEKPSLAQAQQMLAEGCYYWNAGIFVAQAATINKELRDHAPQIAAVSLGPATVGADWYPDRAGYRELPTISFDYAVAEKSSRTVLIVDSALGWCDVGSWQSFAAMFDDAGDGNRVHGEAVFANARDNAVYAGGHRLVAVAGASKLNVIDTPDALLVCGHNAEGQVREIVARLDAAGDQRTSLPAAEERPWGRYRALAAGPGWRVKIIEVEPGCRLSLQAHEHRSETWTTCTGIMTVTINERVFAMPVGESCHIPVQMRHRMENQGNVLAAVVEVQLGDHLSEDDIRRFEDDYGR